MKIIALTAFICLFSVSALAVPNQQTLANFVARFVHANQEAQDLVRSRTLNPNVIKFSKQAYEIALRLDIVSVSIALEQELDLDHRGEFDADLKDLKTKSGPEFDKAYAEFMIRLSDRIVETLSESEKLEDSPVGALFSLLDLKIKEFQKNAHNL